MKPSKTMTIYLVAIMVALVSGNMDPIHADISLYAAIVVIVCNPPRIAAIPKPPSTKAPGSYGPIEAYIGLPVTLVEQRVDLRLRGKNSWFN